MFHFLFNSNVCQRFGYAAVLTLPLCLAGCDKSEAVPQATTTPTTQVQPDRYYLNGQLSARNVIESIDPKTITRMEVLRGQQAADYAHDATITGAILVQTK